MCNSNVQLFPNTGTGKITTANTNLNGTGAIVNVLTAASNGTLINQITVKSQQTNTQGMVRLYIWNTVTYFLIQEVMIPANVPTGVVQSFAATLSVSINLQAGYKLAASTQNGETFSVIAYGADYSNCGCP